MNDNVVDVICSAEVAKNLINNSHEPFSICKPVDEVEEVEPKYLTILAIAKAKGVKADERGGISAGAIAELGLPFMGGCEICEATIACYNAYPTRSGYLRCSDCLGDTGFTTVEEFDAHEN